MSVSKPTNVIEDKEDFLDVDPEIRGQSFVCLSFLSPEKVLDKKELFFFQRFMKFYEAKIRFDALEKFLANVVREQNEKVGEERERILGRLTEVSSNGDEGVDEDSKEDLREDIDQAFTRATLKIVDVFDSFKSYLETHREEMTSKKNIVEAYEEFMFNKGKELEDEFHAANEFRTTVRGLKVRGSYSTHKEASVRAKKLQKDDPLHHVFVGQVGYWLPWDPNPNEIEDQQYAEKELNELMQKHKEQQEVKKELFEEEKARKVEAAKAEAAVNSQKALTDNPREEQDATAEESTSASTSVVEASAEQVSGITEARELMREMDDNRIPVNPGEEYKARQRARQEKDTEVGDDEE
jgi:PAS domain-containing protein